MAQVEDVPRQVPEDCPSELLRALVEEHNKLVDMVNLVHRDLTIPRPRKLALKRQ